MDQRDKQGRKIKIAWLSYQVLDLMFSKTAYYEICTNLANLGNHVDFFATRSKKLFRSDNSNMRLFTIPLRAYPFISHTSYVISLLIVLPFYIAARKPDFIVTEPRFGFSLFSYELKFFPRRLRPVLILDIRSTPVEVHNFRTHLGALWFNSSVISAKKTVDGFTVATRPMKNQICKELHVNPQSMYVWNNGVNLNVFSPEKYNEVKIRKRHCLNDKFIVFYHGAFRINGGIKETIRSIKLLERKYPDIVLFLLGEGPALPLYKQIIQENKIQDKIIIHPRVDYAEVPKYIAVSDVGIVPLPNIPDWRNQSPLKLVEYLAMKKLVIATDIPANRELMGENECGIYLSSVNPEEIAKAIELAYKRKEKHTICETSENIFPIKDYDWKKVAENFENYLQEFDKARNHD